MAIIKAIFIFFTGFYALSKIMDGVNNKYITAKDKSINLLEIVIGIALTFLIFEV